MAATLLLQFVMTVLPLTSSTQSDGRTLSVAVDGGRPLERTIRQLEERLKVVITYEDPPMLAAHEMIDVTQLVQKGRNPNGGVRTVVPRGGPWTFAYTETSAPRLDTRLVLQELLVQYHLSGYPGRFRVVADGVVFHVIPTGGSGGRPLLDIQVTPPAGPITAYSMLQSIAGGIAARGRRLAIGVVPLRLLVGTKMTSKPEPQTARTLLMDLVRATGQILSWNVRCSPDGEAVDPCFVNIHRVQ
jgi:hypothetical protein